MATKTSSSGIYAATGRRKSAVARVRLEEGGKETLVNGQPMDRYFPQPALRMVVEQPFQTVQLAGRFGFSVDVRGGGLAGQAGAVRLGIARALVQFDPALRSPLRQQGFLTRDPRAKERKKYGHKGARRSFQYTKR